MGIDPIGKPPGTDKAVDAATAGKPGAFNRALEAGGSEQARGSDSVELIDQLERGEIDVERYLQVRVDQSVAHLESVLTPEQLDLVKQRLHEQMRTDPVLIELTRRATGGVGAEMNK